MAEAHFQLWPHDANFDSPIIPKIAKETTGVTLFFCVRQCVCSQWHILSLCCFFIFGNATKLCWVLCGRMHLHVTLNTIDGWFKSSKSERSLIFAWHRNKLIIFVFLMCLFPLYLCAGQCLYTKSIPYFDYPNLHIFSWNFWTHKIYATTWAAGTIHEY